MNGRIRFFAVSLYFEYCSQFKTGKFWLDKEDQATQEKWMKIALKNIDIDYQYAQSQREG